MTRTRFWTVGFALACLVCLHADATKVAIRCAPWYGKEMREAGSEAYPVCYAQVDMGYDGQEVGLFKTKTIFPEYYVGWEEGEMDTNPATNPLVQYIRRSEEQGTICFGVKISRETLVGKPAGPVAADERILFSSDVSAIRTVFKAAKTEGILERDDYMLFQMVYEPDVFSDDPVARSIVKMMDGVCLEVHHFNVYWPIVGSKSDRSNPKDVVRGALWVLDQENIHGQPLEYVLYYGPFKGRDCKDYEGDPFRDWLVQYWAEGLPKSHPRITYDLNAFKHDCGSTIAGVPETDDHTILGYCRWLIEQVKQ